MPQNLDSFANSIFDELRSRGTPKHFESFAKTAAWLTGELEGGPAAVTSLTALLAVAHN